MAPIVLSPRTSLPTSHDNPNLHPITKREKFSKANIITLAVLLTFLLSISLFFAVFVPRWTRKKKLKEHQQTVREMLQVEERATGRRARGSSNVGAAAGRGFGAGQRQGQGHGQGQGVTEGGTGGGGGAEAIPMDDVAVPDGNGGWVEPPPPYVVDPKPAYHP
ncbi:hypothetical protein NEUTE2DRAFT_101063 [Neurospora tetrasperma FGSC 2509]|nr:hypothetical protein NEUTE2DRAFT_101063 [Neurospora tetrasperma FGSC 2509]